MKRGMLLLVLLLATLLSVGGIAEAVYTPGTYTAESQGMMSMVGVEVTIDENGIASVVIDVSGETPERVEGLGEALSAAIVAA